MISHILDFLNMEMEKPHFFGSFKSSWFHYLSLILIIILMYYLTKRFKKNNNKDFKKIIFIMSLIMIVLEVYKQIIFSYQANWHYQWYAFPFQFCSTPMYVMLILSLTKSKKLEEYLTIFLGTYGLFAGLSVMLYPATVFVSTIGINIQTMTHHGFMAAIGFSIIANKLNLKLKELFKGSLVFLSLVLIAIILNSLFNASNNPDTFNMFFINPRFKNELPVLSLFQDKVSPFIFILIYIFGFTFVSFIILGIATTIKTVLTNYKYNQKEILKIKNNL